MIINENYEENENIGNMSTQHKRTTLFEFLKTVETFQNFSIKESSAEV